MRLACLVILAAAAAGCQVGPPTVSNRALIAHLPGIDFAGLNSMTTIESVKVSCSLPSDWIEQATERNALYTVQQWKSPTGYTGSGVVYAHLPFAINARALLWFAKLEYGKETTARGKALGEWTDALGRPWFEAEDEKYHVRGYAVTSGRDAWIVFYGYKVKRPLSPTELSLAARSVDTVIPQTMEQQSASPGLASAGESRKP